MSSGMETRAVDAENLGASAPATAPAATTPQSSGAPAKESQNSNKITTGSSFIVLSNQMQRASVLSPACRNFIDTLTKCATAHGLKIDTINTGTTNAQVVYKPGSSGVALIYASGSIGPSKRTYADKISEVVSVFNSRSATALISVITGFVIDESSYDRAENCFAAIFNAISTVEAESNHTINCDSFKVNGMDIPLVASTKPEIYREYVRAVSPFGFSERDDIGFLVGIPKQNCPFTEKFDIKPDTHNILFAVTGYTQFVRIDAFNPVANPMQPAKTVQPVIHITGIISDIPSMVMLPPAITIAAQSFIVHRNWMRPYMTINGKESMNVGNLVMNTDPSGNRTTLDVEAPFQAEQVMQQTCAEPFLCLDITLGRCGIPGIECILDTKSKNGVTVNLQTFLASYFNAKYALHKNIYDNIKVVAGTPVVENTGSMVLDNQVVDSRCGDYLRMFKRIGDYNQVCCLLSQPNDPSARLQQLSDLGVSVQSLYKTRSVILSSAAVTMLAELSPQFELDIMSDSRYNYNFNGLAAAAGIGNMQSMGYMQPMNFGGNPDGPFTRNWN